MRILILLITMLAATLTANAAVTATSNGDTPNRITIRNELLTLVLDLAQGAKVVSLQYAGFDGNELLYDAKVDNGGLFKDLWTTQGWPGEFNARLYEAEIVKAGPDEAVVRTWTRSAGVFKNQEKFDLKDLLLEKTFVLRAEERVLTVRYAITNQGEKGKRPAFWSQNALDFDGQRKNNRYWRPTSHGVDWIDREHPTSANGRWYATPTVAGWNGVSNQTLRRGVMFLMDYNDLQQVYDNTQANTVEWMYDDVAVPVGKTWTTTVRMIPAEGFAAFTHGDAVLLGAVEAKETPAGLRLDHTLAASTRPLSNVTVQTRVKGVRAPWAVEGAPISVETLAFAPLIRSVDVTGIGPLPCVIEVTVTGTDHTGEPVTVAYADYYGGGAGRNIDLVILEPMYAFPALAKKKQYLKPDTLSLQRNTPAKILFIRGLWAEYHGIDEALKQLGDVTVVDGWMKKSALGETLGGFPAAYEDLLGYDVIILGNVSGPMLSDVGQEMLADFLTAGGGVLLLSGDRTYGQTHFDNARFASLLPFISSPNDYGRLAEPQPLKPGAEHAVLKGVKFGKDDVVLYTHRLKAKDGAVVAATLTDGTPALLLSNESAPRVAAMIPLPFGDAPQGQRLYSQSEAWHRLLANTLNWLRRL
jgi:uncharacterized membrane protein